MKMNKEELSDLLMLAGVLPVIADKLEDLNVSVFSQNLKRKATMLIEEIRKNDANLLQGGDITIFEEQNNIGISFREWCKTNFDK